MSAEEDIRTALAGAAPVIAICGTRIYNEVMPKNPTYPAMHFQRTVTDTLTTIHGTIAMETATMQVGCYARTREEAEDLATASTAALLAAGLIQIDRAGGYSVEMDLHSATLQFNHYK